MAVQTQIELISHSPEQTQRLGRALAARLAGGQVVALTGHLGAGKTQWVKGLAAGLGIDPNDVHSPTFTLINEYAPQRAGPSSGPAQAMRLYHIDVYRLSGAAELDAIGFGEIVATADGIVAVEWADRVAELIGPDAIWIEGSMPTSLSPSERRYVIRSGLPNVLDSLRSD